MESIILVEFYNGDTTEAEAFKSKESLIEWYNDLLNPDEYPDVLKDFNYFKDAVNFGQNRIKNNSYGHEFTIYYDYKPL